MDVPMSVDLTESYCVAIFGWPGFRLNIFSNGL